MKEYAVYKGDQLLAIGTKEDCAEILGVKPETVYWNSTPTGKRRLAARKNPHKCLCVERIEDDED